MADRFLETALRLIPANATVVQLKALANELAKAYNQGLEAAAVKAESWAEQCDADTKTYDGYKNLAYSIRNLSEVQLG